MNTYTLKLFNTGQITIPKKWREKFNTKNFMAKETKDGLLIQPINDKKTIYFEEKNGFGIYSEDALPVDNIVNKIDEFYGSN